MSKAQELKPELLPCPMCGGAEILVKKRKTTMVECKSCGLVVFNYQDGIERDAIAHWNLRAPASSEQQATQQYSELVEHVIDAARNAMNESVESMDDFIIESHLAAALSLALDELDAARASNGVKT